VIPDKLQAVVRLRKRATRRPIVWEMRRAGRARAGTPDVPPRLVHALLGRGRLGPGYLVVGQDRQERYPGAHGAPVLFGHHASHLGEVAKVVHNPCGEEFAKCHTSQGWMDTWELEGDGGQAPGVEEIKIG